MELYREAVVSDDQKYRYTLYREWREDIFDPLKILNFVMLNPSKADGLVDDPTIRKCIGYAKIGDFNAIRVVNLFALRSTDPKQLQYEYVNGGDTIGPLNDSYVRELPSEETVCVAWGSTFQNKPWVQNRIAKTFQFLNRKLYCLKKTKDGHPCHPVMLGYGPLIEF
jgi:hypothetical protein